MAKNNIHRDLIAQKREKPTESSQKSYFPEAHEYDKEEIPYIAERLAVGETNPESLYKEALKLLSGLEKSGEDTYEMWREKLSTIEDSINWALRYNPDKKDSLTGKIYSALLTINRKDERGEKLFGQLNGIYRSLKHS